MTSYTRSGLKRALPQSEGAHRDKNGVSEPKPRIVSPHEAEALDEQQPQKNQAEARRLRRRTESGAEDHHKASEEENEEDKKEEKEEEESKSVVVEKLVNVPTIDLSSVSAELRSGATNSLGELATVVTNLAETTERMEHRMDDQDQRLIKLEQHITKQQQQQPQEEATTDTAGLNNSATTEQIQLLARSLNLLEKTVNAQREAMLRHQQEQIEALQSQISSLTASHEKALRQERERIQFIYSRLFQIDQRIQKIRSNASKGGMTGDLESKEMDEEEMTMELPKEAVEADYVTAWQACERGNLASITSLLAHTMIDVNYSYEGEHRWTLLHCVAWNGHAAIARILIDLGANLNAVSKDHNTALHYAASQGHADVAKLLLDAGANIQATDIDQRTPLHCAALRDRVSVVQILLDRGANPRVKNKDGKTPHDLCSSWHPKVAALLRAKIFASGGTIVEARRRREWDSDEENPL